MSNGSVTWSYTYDDEGLRTQRTDGEKIYNYIYSGGLLRYMEIENNGVVQHRFVFRYGADGRPYSVRFGDEDSFEDYFYVLNLQGDVIGIVDSNGVQEAGYAYDAWGNLTPASMIGSGIGTLNPLRYRGYVYDQETGLYYLQSRYYNPAWGRFINADAFVSTGQGLLGNNMFAYCGNNPIIHADVSGTRMVSRSSINDGGNIPPLEFITNQSAEGIGEKRLGISTVSHGGCGVVATYNALLSMGEEKEFSEILSYYNSGPDNKLLLGGLLGILPNHVADYFRNNGYSVVVTSNTSHMDIYSAIADASILWYMYPNTFMGVDVVGAHYEAYERTDNGYRGYNTSYGGVYLFSKPSDYAYYDGNLFAIGIYVFK